MHDDLKKHKVRCYRGGGAPLVAMRTRPNDPCPCGSGKKAKRCCGAETRCFGTKADVKEEGE